MVSSEARAAGGLPSVGDATAVSPRGSRTAAEGRPHRVAPDSRRRGRGGNRPDVLLAPGPGHRRQPRSPRLSARGVASPLRRARTATSKVPWVHGRVHPASSGPATGRLGGWTPSAAASLRMTAPSSVAAADKPGPGCRCRRRECRRHRGSPGLASPRPPWTSDGSKRLSCRRGARRRPAQVYAARLDGTGGEEVPTIFGDCVYSSRGTSSNRPSAAWNMTVK